MSGRLLKRLFLAAALIVAAALPGVRRIAGHGDGTWRPALRGLPRLSAVLAPCWRQS